MEPIPNANLSANPHLNPSLTQVDTQTWNLLSGARDVGVGGTAYGAEAFRTRKLESLYFAAAHLITTEQWQGHSYIGTLFSSGGEGLQWENTGSAFLAFEWFMRHHHSDSADAEEAAKQALIAQRRDQLNASLQHIFSARAQALAQTADDSYQGIAASFREAGAPTGFGWSYFDDPHSASSAYCAMALEVAIGGGSLDKYNPYSPSSSYTEAEALWQSMRRRGEPSSSGDARRSATETAAEACGAGLPPAPTTASLSPGIEGARLHMDSWLRYALSRQPTMRTLNNDAAFFAFPTYAVTETDSFRDLADTYDNALMIIYLLNRADDEARLDAARARCYLRAAVEAGATFLRLMQAAGYQPSLSTAERRLGESFVGLFARYPVSWWDPAPGDLGNNAYMGLALVKLGAATSDTGMHTAGLDIAYLAEHRRVAECANVPTVTWSNPEAATSRCTLTPQQSRQLCSCRHVWHRGEVMPKGTALLCRDAFETIPSNPAMGPTVRSLAPLHYRS